MRLVEWLGSEASRQGSRPELAQAIGAALGAVRGVGSLCSSAGPEAPVNGSKRARLSLDGEGWAPDCCPEALEEASGLVAEALGALARAEARSLSAA